MVVPDVDVLPNKAMASPVQYGPLLEAAAPGGGLNCTCVSTAGAVSYTHLRAHETVLDLVCRLLLENKKTNQIS